jgi:hypothetical protein
MPSDDELTLLRQVAKWTRESALPLARARVESALDSEPKKRVYAAMDGSVTVNQLEKLTGANHNDIRGWVAQWVASGLAELDGATPTAAFTFAELGLAAPSPKAPKAATKKGAKG